MNQVKNYPLRLAFYGKGGIGKSTVAAHISAALAQAGKRVLHIGCDPKSDSTRCLTKSRIPTVLQQLAAKEEALTKADILYPGAFGVSCIEAGGPEPGVGCAGLGIGAMADELNRLGILDEGWDVIIYDVLGDVVCGGFAMPMRRRFIDRVFLVTSADFMSLYAANNIMKALLRYATPEEPLLGGLILNRYKDISDIKIAAAFAEKTNCGIIGALKESSQLRYADYCKETVLSLFPKRMAAGQIRALALKLWRQEKAYCPVFMEESAMDNFHQQIFKKAVNSID